MSDTPRTDAADLNAIVYDKKVVFKEFAEQLERENEALRKKLAYYEAITTGTEHKAIEAAITRASEGK